MCNFYLFLDSLKSIFCHKISSYRHSLYFDYQYLKITFTFDLRKYPMVLNLHTFLKFFRKLRTCLSTWLTLFLKNKKCTRIKPIDFSSRIHLLLVPVTINWLSSFTKNNLCAFVLWTFRVLSIYSSKQRKCLTRQTLLYFLSYLFY